MKIDKNNNYNKGLKSLARALRKDMTKAEACLWKYVLKGRQMRGFQFNRQRPVLTYIADFMCKELNLIIEVDGISLQDEEVINNDRIRQKILEEAGFTVLRFDDDDVLNHINSVHQSIDDWIEQQV